MNLSDSIQADKGKKKQTYSLSEAKKYLNYQKDE